MRIDRLIFRTHALRRMFERGVSEIDVRAILEDGEVIRDYPDDRPYPSRLILGWRNGHPLHVVAAETTAGEWIIITVYEPTPDIWHTGFKTKRTP